MGTDHPSRDKQAHRAKPSLWAAEPIDDSPSIFENPFQRMNLHFGMAKTPTTLTRRLRSPAFPGFWFSYRTSSKKTSFTHDNAVAVSWQNRSQCWRAHAPYPRGPAHLDQSRMGSGKISRLATTSNCANFASSLPVSGEGIVSILMPFLPEENWHGRERLIVSGRRLVWWMRYRNMIGAEKTLLRARPG
jgi:hypothetical protein